MESACSGRSAGSFSSSRLLPSIRESQLRSDDTLKTQLAAQRQRRDLPMFHGRILSRRHACGPLLLFTVAVCLVSWTESSFKTDKIESHAHISIQTGYFLVVNQLPGYMKSVLHYDIKTNGLLSSLPYLGKYCMSVVASHFADYLRSTGKITTTVARKGFTA